MRSTLSRLAHATATCRSIERSSRTISTTVRQSSAILQQSHRQIQTSSRSAAGNDSSCGHDHVSCGHAALAGVAGGKICGGSHGRGVGRGGGVVTRGLHNEAATSDKETEEVGTEGCRDMYGHYCRYSTVLSVCRMGLNSPAKTLAPVTLRWLCSAVQRSGVAHTAKWYSR